MSQTLELIIRARDEASAKLKGITGDIVAMGGGLVAALFAAQQAWKNFIEPVVIYNRTIEQASAATGMAVEDFARLAEAGSDLGITMEQLTTAFAMATKNGFQVSVDSLASLADRLARIEDPTEKAALLAGIFGRNWAAIYPILQNGSTGLRQMTDAVNDSLVPTRDAINRTEELATNVDEVNDAFTGLRNILVGDILPAVMDFTGTLVQFSGIGLVGSLFGPDKDPVSKLRPVADILRAIGGAAADAGDEIENVSARLILANVAALIVKGENQAALAMYDVYLEAQRAEDKIQAVIDGLLALNGTSATAFINLVTSGGAPGGGQAIPMPETRPGGWNPMTGSELQSFSNRGWTQKKWYNGRWIYQAQGGEIGTGGEFVVGEHGAERFTPSTPGTISPNNDSLAQAINRMVRTLPTVITDAIERSK